MSRLASLEDFARVLTEAGYAVEVRELAGERVLLAETAYILLACMDVDALKDLSHRVSDVQAALTQVAAAAPSARRWDLYLLIHIRVPVSDRDEGPLEELQADTRYVRKFVRVRIDSDEPDSLDRALRPFLPLRPAAVFDLLDPLEALRRELIELDLPAHLADAALSAFGRTQEVVVP
jgi:hypothetical protein